MEATLSGGRFVSSPTPVPTYPPIHTICLSAVNACLKVSWCDCNSSCSYRHSHTLSGVNACWLYLDSAHMPHHSLALACCQA
jgi:hypothetical protein